MMYPATRTATNAFIYCSGSPSSALCGVVFLMWVGRSPRCRFPNTVSRLLRVNSTRNAGYGERYWKFMTILRCAKFSERAIILSWFLTPCFQGAPRVSWYSKMTMINIFNSHLRLARSDILSINVCSCLQTMQSRDSLDRWRSRNSDSLSSFRI